MQPEFLARLPDALQRLVADTERTIGFQVEVLVDAARAGDIPGEAASMACKVGRDFAHMLVADPDGFRAGSVFHELLHIRRFLVEGVPTLMDCADYEAWTPALSTALAKHDNAFEHLLIVPLELRHYPERREHWEAVMARVWDEMVAQHGDEVSRRQLALASWAFLQLVLPDSPSIAVARVALEASHDLEHAARFCQALFPLLGDKAAAIRVWFDFQAIPLEVAPLSFFEPREQRTREVPLRRT